MTSRKLQPQLTWIFARCRRRRSRPPRRARRCRRPGQSRLLPPPLLPPPSPPGRATRTPARVAGVRTPAGPVLATVCCAISPTELDARSANAALPHPETSSHARTEVPVGVAETGAVRTLRGRRRAPGRDRPGRAAVAPAQAAAGP